MGVAQLRSMLYVPAIRPEWVEKGIGAGADALILDLEDSVPAQRKAEAAGLARESLALHGDSIRLLVRTNPVSGDRWLDDLEQVVTAGLYGLVLPKCESPEEVAVVDAVVTQLEARAGVEPKSVRLAPMFESAKGLARAAEILSASGRVGYSWAGHTLDGDLGRDMRIGWTAEGSESFYARSKVVVDTRAAGVPFPTTGLWALIEDTDGLRTYAEQNLLLGFTGMQVIHPSHVDVVNEVFTPSSSEVARLERVLEAMRDSQLEGGGAILLDGAMVDEAMAAHAARRLSEIAGLGVPVKQGILDHYREGCS